jgi:hypothetical protein
MSSVSHTEMPLSACQQYKENSGSVQDKVYDSTETRQDMPSSAYEHHQQKRNESKQENNNGRYTGAGAPRTLGVRLTLNFRPDMLASALTSQAMTRFEEQPDNNLQPLDDRVTEYRKSSPILGEQKSAKEHCNQMAGSIKDWSDKWERLERN